MKVALGIRELLPEKGGAERYCFDLVKFLAQKGVEVHVFTSAYTELDTRITIHLVPVVPLWKWVRCLTFAINCRRMMRKERFDCIMGIGDTLDADLLQPHGGVHWRWFWRGLEGYRKPFPWAFKLLGRALSTKQWVKGWIEDYPYARAKKVVAISEMVRRDIIDYYGISEEQVVTIYNGVDTERFHPRNKEYRDEVRRRYGIENSALLLLFVSHNFRLKGLRYLIEALPLIKMTRAGVRLMVIGRDRAAPYLRLAKSVECADDVIFVGAVQRLERFYAAADIMVHPTFYDPCSLAVLEALASGLPVITTIYNGAGWIITEGKEGYVLQDPRDVAGMAQKILFLADRSRLEAAAASARILAERHTLAGAQRALLEVMEGITSRISGRS